MLHARFLLTAVCAVLVLAVSPAVAGRGSRASLPVLRASVAVEGAGVQTTRFSLGALDPENFKVLFRSRQSVVLGYPARNPCARTKLTLRLKATDADPLAHVRNAMPTAEGEGQEVHATGPDLSAGAQRLRAWRVNGDIQRSSKFVLGGITARRVTKAGTPMIQELTFAGETTAGYPCATGNRFTIGPGFGDVLRLGSR